MPNSSKSLVERAGLVTFIGPGASARSPAMGDKIDLQADSPNEAGVNTIVPVDEGVIDGR